MSYQNKRIYFDVNEATNLKLQSFTGKSYLQSRDYQNILQTLIDNTYEKTKGKKI